MDAVAVERHGGETEQQRRGGHDGLSPPWRQRRLHRRARRWRDASRLAIDDVLALDDEGAIVLLDGVLQGHDQQLAGGALLAGVAEQPSSSHRRGVGSQGPLGADLSPDPHPPGEVGEQRAPPPGVTVGPQSRCPHDGVEVSPVPQQRKRPVGSKVASRVAASIWACSAGRVEAAELVSPRSARVSSLIGTLGAGHDAGVVQGADLGRTQAQLVGEDLVGVLAQQRGRSRRLARRGPEGDRGPGVRKVPMPGWSMSLNIGLASLQRQSSSTSWVNVW
jgi:hypothetical protein